MQQLTSQGSPCSNCSMEKSYACLLLCFQSMKFTNTLIRVPSTALHFSTNSCRSRFICGCWTQRGNCEDLTSRINTWGLTTELVSHAQDESLLQWSGFDLDPLLHVNPIISPDFLTLLSHHYPQTQRKKEKYFENDICVMIKLYGEMSNW